MRVLLGVIGGILIGFGVSLGAQTVLLDGKGNIISPDMFRAFSAQNNGDPVILRATKTGEVYAVCTNVGKQ